jgi:predicted RNA-binding Zn-ribbon protein involved in translation (DUF1610 family)
MLWVAYVFTLVAVRCGQPLTFTLELTVFRCPHCQRLGITTLSKLLSGPAVPARCEICGKLSHQNATLQLVASGLSFPVFIVAVFVAMEYSSWWPVIALPVLGIIVTATALTHFGFESNGKRHFDVTVPGWPRVEEGMTVIALLKRPNDWSRESFMGWADCSDGSVVCEDPKFNIGIFAVLSFFLLFFWITDVQNPWVAEFIVAVVFGGCALWFLYRSAKSHLVKRSLLLVARNIKHNQPTMACGASNNAVKALPSVAGTPLKRRPLP